MRVSRPSISGYRRPAVTNVASQSPSSEHRTPFERVTRIELAFSAWEHGERWNDRANRSSRRLRAPRGRQLGESGSGSGVSGQRIKRRHVLALIAEIGQLRTVPPMTIQTAPEPTHLLSMRDLSDRLDTPIDSLYKWSRRGFPDFPRALRLPNGQIRVRVQDLNDWIEGRAQ